MEWIPLLFSSRIHAAMVTASRGLTYVTGRHTIRLYWDQISFTFYIIISIMQSCNWVKPHSSYNTVCSCYAMLFRIPWNMQLVPCIFCIHTSLKARANASNMLCQHVTFVCTTCWAMLHDVGTCCVQLETSQTFRPTYANISFVLVTDEPGGRIPMHTKCMYSVIKSIVL